MKGKLLLMLPAVGCHQVILNLRLEYKNVLTVRVGKMDEGLMGVKRWIGRQMDSCTTDKWTNKLYICVYYIYFLLRSSNILYTSIKSI